MAATTTPATHSPPRCHFLALPPEVRVQIYRLVLPYTLKHNSLRSTPCSPSPTPSNGPLPSNGHESIDSSSSSNHEAHHDHHPLLPPPATSPTLHRSNSMTSLLRSIKHAPSSSTSSTHATLWQRGSTALLATNQQIHAEAADALYGGSANVFSLVVSYDKVQFAWAWQVAASGLQPQGRLDVAAWVARGYVRRMRSVVLTIEHVDGYTAMMKYNCGSAGLVAGLRSQLERLVRVLRRRGRVGERSLKSVEVRAVGSARRLRVADGFDDRTLPESIVEPLRRLRGVRRAKVMDDFGVRVARRLEENMMSDELINASEDDDVDDRQPSMEQLKRSRWANLAEPISPAGYYSMASAPLHGFNEI